MTLICLDPCQWSLMSLITGNKVKKHKPRYCEKKKDKANKRIYTSHSKRVEQAFYTKYQGFQSFLIIGGTSQILEGT
jgi:hypothetical protein